MVIIQVGSCTNAQLLVNLSYAQVVEARLETHALATAVWLL